MGADPKSTVAAIGPSIEKCCYCVREDFYKEFFRVAGEELTRKYLSYAEDGVWYADLKGANREILLSAGILEENIDVSDKCTCCLPEEFYSHRFSKGSRGTMLSVITL